jgi:hypothetical protein
MGSSLNNTTPANTYPALIKVGNDTPIDATLKTLSDGNGNNLPIQASSSTINFTGTTTGLPFQDFGLYPYTIVCGVEGGNVKTITSATSPSGTNLIGAAGWTIGITGLTVNVTHPLGDTIFLGTSQGINPPSIWIRQYSAQQTTLFAMVQNSTYTVVSFYANTSTNAGFSSSQTISNGLTIVFMSSVYL